MFFLLGGCYSVFSTYSPIPITYPFCANFNHVCLKGIDPFPPSIKLLKL